MITKLANGVSVRTKCVGAFPTRGDVKCYPSKDCVLPAGLPDDYHITLVDAELSGRYEITEIVKLPEGGYSANVRYQF